MKLLIFSFLLASCSHTGYRHYKWTNEISRITSDKKEMMTLSKWVQEYIDKHIKKLEGYTLAVKSHKQKFLTLKGINKNLEVKKIKLELGRKKSEVIEQHHHFLEDYEEMKKIINRLRKFKMDVESHQEHHHH